ncbi:hypothetical protein [Methanocalculus sp. MSAO_Arc2]|uniref:hypothetical protein n=1 Tax=Methanocalculus sp. MSAO_Arc2 TaxID=2293855 RepID=UPI00269B76C6
MSGTLITGIRNHPYIRHGSEIGLGDMPDEIISDNLSESIAGRITELLIKD